MVRPRKKGASLLAPAVAAEGNLERAALLELMARLKALEPKAFDQLASLAAQENKPTIDDFDKWCDEWRLPFQTVSQFVIPLVDYWRLNQKARHDRSWTRDIAVWTGRLERLAQHSYDEQNRDPILPIEAFPQIENLEQFRIRAEAHWRVKVRALLRWSMPIFAVRKVKSLPVRRFTWFVEYQIRGRSIAKIAKADQVTKATVSQGIQDIADLLVLQLRPPGKGGRPPRKPHQ